MLGQRGRRPPPARAPGSGPRRARRTGRRSGTRCGPRRPRRCPGSPGRSGPRRPARPSSCPTPAAPRSPRPAASGDRQVREVRRPRCARSPRPSRRRTSPAPRRPARARTIASATMPAAGTAQTSLRWLIARAGSPVATSTVARARGTVEIGFIAARTRSGSPVVIPPSMPPALAVRRCSAPSAPALDLVVRLRAADAARCRTRRRHRRP